MIRGVVHPAIHGGEERLLRAFDATRVHRLGIRQDVRAHAGVVDVLVRQRDVLKDRQEPLFARHALHGVVQGMQPDERVQRPAMMAGRQVR